MPQNVQVPLMLQCNIPQSLKDELQRLYVIDQSVYDLFFYGRKPNTLKGEQTLTQNPGRKD